MMKLLIHMDVEIIIILCQEFSEENIPSLLSDQLKHIFDDFYWARILGREKLDYSTVDKTAAIL